MPLIRILSEKKQQAYEAPPAFSASERKHFFNLPASLRVKVQSFPNFTNQIGFRLMFGYFLSTRAFYRVEQFREKDIRYLCGQYGMMPFAFDSKQYKTSTYYRHREVILEHFAFQAYQPRVHNPLLIDAIEEQVYSWEDYSLIVDYMVDWLEWRHIERPSYYNLQLVLTKAIRGRDKKVNQEFSRLLLPKHKLLLDGLLKRDLDSGKEEYVLTILQGLAPSDTPGKIKANLEKLQMIQSIFDAIQPLLEQVNLNDNAIRHFGEYVKQIRTAHLFRRESIDRYLHLAAFCAYQRYIFEDWMARTFLSVCVTSMAKASNRERDRLFKGRKQRKKVFQQLLQIAHDKTELLDSIRALVWMNIPATEKERRLQDLLPLKQVGSQSQEELQQIKQDQNFDKEDNFYHFLEEQSQTLQQRASPIIKHLTFNEANSDSSIIHAIQHFRDKEGNITKNAPIDFLKSDEQAVLIDEHGKFKVSLYKMLLFQEITNAIKRGSLNLKYSYKYKAMDDYLIPKHIWDRDKEDLLDKANLKHLKDVKNRLANYKDVIHFHYTQTNNNILKGINKYFRKSKKNNYHVVTPKVEKEQQDISLFPAEALTPMSEVLATVDLATNFLESFQHLQPAYRKKKPNRSVFFAAITAYGCNLGIPAMAKSASYLRFNQLENTINWYFDLNNINRANIAIANFTHQLPLANLYRKKQGELRTSSDGQKIKLLAGNSIFANYSSKYFRKGKGVVAYSFTDERYIPFYSLIIDAAVREAAYVLDGLLHNDAIRSTIHTTDTHGYTEALFGLMDLLGFGFCPNIAKVLDQTLYSFKDNRIPDYREAGYLILPKAYINEQLIADHWDELLRLATSLKLKYCTASQIFKRFNSYSRQHPLYAAIKEYGRIGKTLHVLRFTDDLEMRQDSRKSGNAIESSNRFSSAIFFANGGEMIFLTRKEQQIAEACKRLIKNAIICWNYLYLTRKVQQTRNPKEAQVLVKALKDSTVNAWRHIYFTGTYDFSDENLQDSFDLLHSQNYELNLD